MIRTAGSAGEMKELLLQDPHLRSILNNPNRVHLTAVMLRPGIARFVARMEWEMFSLEERSDEEIIYHVRLFLWGLPWCVVSIDKSREIEASRLAESLGLRFRLGIPAIVRTMNETIFKVYPWGTKTDVVAARIAEEKELDVMPDISWFPIRNPDVRLVDPIRSFSDEEAKKLLFEEEREVVDYVMERGAFSVIGLVPTEGISPRKLIGMIAPTFIGEAVRRNFIRLEDCACPDRDEDGFCDHQMVKVGLSIM